jgi:riboflavin kinase/FMN adenylyltransferase
VVIGNFDGVHRGHQRVFGDVAQAARTSGRPVAGLSFWPHPALVLGRGAPPPMLSTLDERAALLQQHAGATLLVHPFTHAFSQLSPEAFVREVLCDALGVTAVSVGDDFRFGRGRAGDVATLRTLGAELGFEVVAHSLEGDAEGPFSSSRARSLLSAGDVCGAANVLGRPHSLTGVVIHGDARGRTIGFPTANLAKVEQMIPAYGVYAVTVQRQTEGRMEALGQGVMNIGVRPTVDGKELRLEVHLFDLAQDLYGQTLRVELRERLRGEQRFAGLPELMAQIQADAVLARDVLSRLNV